MNKLLCKFKEPQQRKNNKVHTSPKNAVDEGRTKIFKDYISTVENRLIIITELINDTDL